MNQINSARKELKQFNDVIQKSLPFYHPDFTDAMNDIKESFETVADIIQKSVGLKFPFDSCSEEEDEDEDEEEKGNKYLYFDCVYFLCMCMCIHYYLFIFYYFFCV